METILLIASGDRLYREYVCAAVSKAYRLVLVQSQPATWQRPYVVDELVANLDDEAAVLTATLAYAEHHPLAGVLSYDETRVRLAASVAAHLGIAHMDGAAVARCRDKLATRRALDAAGVPSARAQHVATLAEAQAAAQRIGYPVVLKPRGLAGSVGVTLVHGRDELPAAFEVARGPSLPGVEALAGVLVEEYLDGPEISVDCAVLDGDLQIAVVAKKRLGLAPFFEEVGHVVCSRPDASLPRERIREVVVAAHRALGVDRGFTHTELRLTATGPRVIEVNARLGGDLIPYVGWLATGIDAARASAQIAAGRRPRLGASRRGAAAIRFFYPKADLRVLERKLDPCWPVPEWLDRVCWEVSPGDVLRLPPDGFMSRLGFAVVTGESEVECEARLDEVERHLLLESEPLAAPLATVEPGAGDLAPVVPLARRTTSTWWDERVPALPAAAAGHVFDSEAWLQAWERATTERHAARRYLRHTDTPAVDPVYLVEDSPMWNSYETDAGVGPVWEAPVAITPSLYAFYGPNTAPLHHARRIVDRGIEQARLWGAAAFVVGNLEPDVADEWRAVAPPTTSLVLDRAYRADVSRGVEAHLATMSGHARREVCRLWRRSTERGLALTVLRGEAMAPRLGDLATLAHATSSRHGPPLYTLETFAALSRVPGATLLVAERDGEAIGAFLTFLYGDSLYLWAGGHDYARRSELGTYSFLIFESIRFAVREGCRVVEAGRGNFAFKERHGFEPVDLWSLVYLMPGRDRDVHLARLHEMRRGMQAFMPPLPDVAEPIPVRRRAHSA
jgi:carbamoylphosphate synthase large subunit